MFYKYFLLAYFIPFLFVKVNSKGELTNLKCTSLDESFCEFEYCFIKSVNRSCKYFSIKMNMLQIPVTKFKVNLALMKNSNGYKPFFYNITIDGCNFLNSKNRNPFVNFFYKFMENTTNMNHSCPYNHDLIWDKVTIENMHFSEILPFPQGDYALYTNWYTNGKIRADIRFYGTIKS